MKYGHVMYGETGIPAPMGGVSRQARTKAVAESIGRTAKEISSNVVTGAKNAYATLKSTGIEDIGKAGVSGVGAFIQKHPQAVYRGLKWGAVGAAIIGAYGMGSSSGRKRERANRDIRGPMQY